MKLKYDFVINNVAGDVVAVPVGKGGKQFKGYIKLNDTGAFIFNLLKTDITRGEIIAEILKNFEGCTGPQAESAVDKFLETLKEADVLK